MGFILLSSKAQLIGLFLDIYFIERGELYLGSINVWINNKPKVRSSDVDICTVDNYI